MKLLATLALLAGLAVAAPVDTDAVDLAAVDFSKVDFDEFNHAGLEARQSTSENQLEQGSSSGCPAGILIFARGSTESGNMGSSLGPILASSLRSRVGSLWVQGVGGPYTAGLAENLLPRGTSSAAIAEGVRLFNLANTKCPNSRVVTGGYSQGAALIAAAVSDLNSRVREQVKGAVLFGYTKNQQNGGRIPNFPSDRTQIYCAPGDLVCEGTLVVAPPHFSYDDEAGGPAPTFLASKI